MNRVESNLSRCTVINRSPITPEQLARRQGYKVQVVQGKREFHGANPTGNGATNDGYILNSDGTSYDRKLDKHYTSKETAEMHGIDPADYAPYVDYYRNSSPRAHRAFPKKKPTTTARRKHKIEMIYNYVKDRKIVYQIVRIDTPNGTKKIFQRRSAKVKNMTGVERILYNHDDVIKAKVLLVVEGEKCADALNRLLEELGLYGEYVATCVPGGTGGAKWWKELSKYIIGKDVVIFPDNDAPGHKLAEVIKTECMGKAARLAVVALPNLPVKGDVVDYFNNGGTIEDVVRISKEALDQALDEELSEEFEFTSLPDVMHLPRPTSLIRNILFVGTTSVLSAHTGSYKSFIALDMALCVATGIPWHGFEVKQGSVIYIAAEGFYTFQDRALGWSIHKGKPLPPNFHILNGPLSTAEPQLTKRFIERIKAFNPALVIFDTLSQCAAELNENDNSQMARFTNGMKLIADETGTHVMAIHHNAKGTGNYRGASSIKSNVDTFITMERPESNETNRVHMYFEKQKGATLAPICLQSTEIELPITDEYGEPVTTLVFDVIENEIPAHKVHPSTQRSNQILDRVMQVFDDVWNEDKERYGGVKQDIWMKKSITSEMGNICSRTSFFSHVKHLRKTKVIEQVTVSGNSPVFTRKASSSSSTNSSSSTPCTADSAVQVVQQPFGVVLPELSGSADSQESTSVCTKQQNDSKADHPPYKESAEVVV